MSAAANKPRNNDLAMIHIAKKQLGFDDETYRQMLWTIGRVKSSKYLDFAGRNRVLDFLKSRGFKAKPATKAKGKNTTLSNEPQHKMIRGLWLELYDMGVVLDASEQAILRFVKNQKKVDRMEWLTQNQASDLIEALKKWMQRTKRKEAINV